MIPNIGLSLASSSGANPIGQFGNVYGGGSRSWVTWAVIGGVVLLAIVIWKKL